MSTRKWVDKKKGKTYKVVYRSHDDPLYHDEDASEHVLVEVNNPKQKKIKTKAQLEADLQNESNEIRQNEGEAALYGITFDDSKYDYMQHLKPIGTSGEGVFIPKKTDESKPKNKGIVFNDDLELPDEMFASKTKIKETYEDQQNIPDEIAGFQPDMNPALREILTALEDEAYVEEDDDIFQDLLQGGAEEVDESDFEEQFDEWDMDNYEDELAQYDDESKFTKNDDQGWEADFRKFKAVNKNKKNDWDSDDEFDEDEEDVVPDLPTFDNSKNLTKKQSKRKQRQKKGAMTDTSSFSMSSSALFRNEGLTLIDDKFEQILKDYQKNDESDEEEEEKPFDMQTERQDFEDMLDDFLDNHELEGGRRIVKKNEERDRLKKAADSASKGKLAAKRKKERATRGFI
ncbi:hypothetical protein BN7_379 [Wickerhamomyces ciferrii]|uniref:Protein LTV1 n=1 Tax=Wickerhamomyces ciferrii (strain ATCC 14091 / BCRC 22168 / CBS 111 / JCM 3599 / NBRC 0793 / NRRL Y-1031 F-60-10) TaxID=1206466 RepID=K0K7Q3_WICCF|nr:uncharacterized protein BN7_379 [Wickerhamomyces ciferrii]CCH40845.1 hypothetical protein BN7_379 [Wickerhamomyces ciferrii]